MVALEPTAEPTAPIVLLPEPVLVLPVPVGVIQDRVVDAGLSDSDASPVALEAIGGMLDVPTAAAAEAPVADQPAVEQPTEWTLAATSAPAAVLEPRVDQAGASTTTTVPTPESTDDAAAPGHRARDPLVAREPGIDVAPPAPHRPVPDRSFTFPELEPDALAMRTPAHPTGGQLVLGLPVSHGATGPITPRRSGVSTGPISPGTIGGSGVPTGPTSAVPTRWMRPNRAARTAPLIGILAVAATVTTWLVPALHFADMSLGAVVWPLGLLAIVFGIVGLVRRSNRRRALARSILGIVLGAGAIAFGIALTIVEILSLT